MLAVGVIGAALLGNIQDKEAGRELKVQDPAIYAAVVDAPKTSVFGKYQPLDQKKIEGLPEKQKGVIESIQGLAKKRALATVAIFPCIMFVCYLALILYFKSQGGYKPKMLISEKEEELLMMGGVAGPAEM
jgi:hypothetical protein